MDPAHNEFGYYEQYTGSCLQWVQLIWAIYWVLLTTSSVIMNNILGPAYNKFSYYEQYTGSRLQFGYYEQYTGSHSQQVWLLQAIYWVLLTMSSVIMNNILGPAYEFGYYEQYIGSCLQRVSYYEQYTGSYLQWVQFQWAIHLILLTMSSVITSNVLGPTHNEFGYYEQYTGSHIQQVWVIMTYIVGPAYEFGY